MSKVLSFCIGHKPILFDTAHVFTFLSSELIGIDNEIFIDDKRDPFGVNGSSLSEYSQLFYLTELLINGKISADFIYLFQYRKFISPLVYGMVDNTNPYNRLITSNESQIVFPENSFLDNINCDLITGSTVNFNISISQQYSKLHVIDDMICFTACVESSLELNSIDIGNFSNLHGFIPCPTLCFIKTDHFVYIMSILKKIAIIFLQKYFIYREGYQYRSTGYLLERLHSILIFKLLRERQDFNAVTWQRYMIAG